MLTVIVGVVCLVVGFSFGVLFARKNKQGVEKAVAYGKEKTGIN